MVQNTGVALRSLAFAFFLAMLSFGCLGGGEPVPSATPEPLPPLTFEPEATIEPTVTPAPTATLVPTVPPTVYVEPTAAPVPTSTFLPPLERSPAGSRAKALGILEGAFHAMKLVRSVHYGAEVVSRAFDDEGQLVEASLMVSGDFQSPDRERVSYTLSIGGFRMEFEIVSIGGVVYVKDPDTGEWSAGLNGDGQQKSLGDFPELTDFIGAGFDLSELREVEFIGEILLDGRDVYHVSGQISPSVLGGIPEEFSASDGMVRLEYWIGTDDRLVRRARLRFEEDIGGELVEMRLVLRMSGYGEEFNIVAPVIEGEE